MRILGIFAHREDHIVAGWPIMQNDSHQRFLFRVTGDHEETVENSCDAAKIRYCGNADIKNGFAVNPKTGELVAHYKKITLEISALIKTVRPEALFTHNPWGEYGHYDHRFLFSLVYNQFSKLPILITDIRATSSYYNFPKHIPREYKLFYCGDQPCAPDVDFYATQAEIFTRQDAWTKNDNLNLPKYPQSCRLATLNPGVI